MSEKEVESKIAIDPVCGMKVSPTRAAGSYEYENRIYYFCAQSCLKKFQNNPQAYLNQESKISIGNGKSDQVPAHNARELPRSPTDLEATASGELGSYFLSADALEYYCPMDTQIRQREPGSCPICGMALEAIFPSASKGLDDASELKDMKKRLLVSLPFTIPIMALAMPAMYMNSNIVGIGAMPVQLIELILSTPVMFYSGMPILRKGIESFRSGHLNMFSLLAAGSLFSYLASVAFMIVPPEQNSSGHDHIFFEGAVGIITLVLIGQVLELKARKQGKSALEGLLSLAPSTARRIETGSQEARVINLQEVKKNDLLLVLAGDKIPVDGTVRTGESSIDDYILSGNKVPKPRSAGDRVFAGTINLDGSLTIDAESLGKDTVFAHILSTLAKVQSSRSPSQELADRISAVFIPAVMFIAALTLISWYSILGPTGISQAILYAVSVLVIACPCALGLATPLAVSAAISKGAEIGLLTKDARALEMLGQANYVLMDKTGTLTKGEFQLSKILLAENWQEEQALTYAASLEKLSTHPLAKGLVQAASQRNLSLLEAGESKTSAGHGIQGLVDGRKVIVGSARFLQEKGADAAKILAKSEGQIAESKVFLAVDDLAVACFLLSDPAREDAPEVVSQLRALGVKSQIISGDDTSSVRSLAKQLSMDDSSSRGLLLPEDKVGVIKDLQNSKNVVCMVGDGVNDSAALLQADAGIALASGSDIALSTAPLTIMQSELSTIPKAIKLGRFMLITIQENLALAFVYNIMAVICASGALSSLGIKLNPTIAAAVMSVSSLCVIFNSMKLRAKKL